MPLYKNISGQKVTVLAVNINNDPPTLVTGDAANITASISKDGALGAATDDVNPTEVDAVNQPGLYQFDLLQEETNADIILISALSSTTGVVLDQLEYLVEQSVPQTGDGYARLGSPAGASVSADIASNSAAISGLNNLSAADIDARLAAYNVVATTDLPSNFGSLGINASGHITRVVLVDTTTTNTDQRGTDNALLASGYTAPDNAGISTCEQDTANLLVQGAAIKAKTDQMAFTAGDVHATLDGEQVVASNMRGTDGANTTPPDNAGVAAIKAVADKLDGTLEDDGGTQRFTANALEQAPSGGGGDATEAKQDTIIGNQATLLARTGKGVTINTSGQADAGGDIATPIKRGVDYNTTAGNAFTWTLTGFPASPWDSGTTAVLGIKQDCADSFTTVGTVAISHDGDETLTPTASFTDTETTGLTADVSTSYQLTLTNGSNTRIVTGNWSVTE